jgi:hypothetical protein
MGALPSGCLRSVFIGIPGKWPYNPPRQGQSGEMGLGPGGVIVVSASRQWGWVMRRGSELGREGLARSCGCHNATCWARMGSGRGQSPDKHRRGTVPIRVPIRSRWQTVGACPIRPGRDRKRRVTNSGTKPMERWLQLMPQKTVIAGNGLPGMCRTNPFCTPRACVGRPSTRPAGATTRSAGACREIDRTKPMSPEESNGL